MSTHYVCTMKILIRVRLVSRWWYQNSLQCTHTQKGGELLIREGGYNVWVLVFNF